MFVGDIHKLFTLAGGLSAGAAETLFSDAPPNKENYRAHLNFFFVKMCFCD